MAEALLCLFDGKDFKGYSAGTEPKELQPTPIEITKESNLDISQHKSKHIEVFPGQTFDLIVTVCDRARATVQPNPVLVS